MARPRKYGPVYGKTAKASIKKMIAEGSVIAVKPAKKTPAKVSSNVKSYVKKLINSNEETKFYTSNIASKAPLLGSGFNTTGSFGYNNPSNIIPVIQQGVGQQQRVGNAIQTKGYLQVRGSVLALPTNATTNSSPNMPFYVRIVVWRQKQSMTTVSNTQILDNGTATGGNDFQGSLDDLMIPFNKDRFQIGAVRTFMLQPNATTGTYSNENLSKYPVSKFFRFNVKLPKKLIFNDSVLDPTNCRWYFSAGVVNADGTLLVNTQVRAVISADAVLRYQDA